METINIKRYPNRKLYSSSLNKWISLEEIALYVKRGKNIKVYDSKTNKDITVKTLLSSLKFVDIEESVLYNLIRG
jgi:polyhydroxyalkanoate synthesis regulator protein